MDDCDSHKQLLSVYNDNMEAYLRTIKLRRCAFLCFYRMRC